MIRRIGCKVINGGYVGMEEKQQDRGDWWFKISIITFFIVLLSSTPWRRVRRCMNISTRHVPT